MRIRPRTTIESLEARVHLSAARPSYNTGTGFFVSNGEVYDANGEAFVIRGFNQNHWWGTPSENFAAIDHVAKTGANAVRAVFNKDLPGITTSSGSDTPAERRAIVEEIIANNMVPVVEDHAVTNETYVNDPNGLHQVVTNWLDPGNVSWLQQYEQQVILNIANEWGPAWSSTNHVWRDSYITQVQRLRAANIDNLIMIDAGGWGQDINTIRNDAAAVLNADPQHNIVFSIHFYSQWRTEERSFDVNQSTFDVNTELTAVRNAGLPIVVGEFSWESLNFASYRTRRVLEICEQLDIGYMGWAWNHNSPAGLNMLVDVPGGSVDYQYNSNADLTAWGDLLINDPDVGIKATSVRATIFPPDAPRFILEKTTVHVPETGQALARVRLSKAPAANVTFNLTKLAGGDANLALAGGATLTFTPANWNQYQPILLSAASDVDTTAGTAKFQLAASGMLSTDVIAKELDSGIATGSFTLTPTHDRDTQSDNASGTNTTVSVSFWNHVYMKYDLSGVGGKAGNAVLRVYRNQWESNLTYRVWLALDDNWTQATAPASLPGRSSLVLSQVVPSGLGYVDFNVTDLVNGQLLSDRTATIVISTSSSNWMTVNTKENASNRPQLVITATEAVPPQLVSAGFDHQSSPNRLQYTFSENVAASLGTSDVLVESLSNSGAPPTLAAPTYNSGTQTASFNFSPAVLPNGNYRATLNPAGVTDAAANAMLLGHSLDFFALAADANRDRHVDAADQAILTANFGQSGRTFSQGDFTHDGVVNAADQAVLDANWHIWLPPQGPLALPSGGGSDAYALQLESPTMLRVFAGADTAPTWRIPLGAVTALSFDGAGGSDSLTMLGSTAADTATFNVNAATLGGIALTHVNVESIRFDGKGGFDILAVNGGPAVVFPATQQLQSLTLSGGASAAVSPGANAVIVTRALYLGPDAVFDLNDNDMVLDYANPLESPAADVEAWVRSGYNSVGDWLGKGVTSTAAAVDGNYALAVADNASLAAPFGGAQGGPTFSGVDVDLTSVLVKFTHRADLNLDGRITPDDSAIFGGNYDENQPAVWATGDLNYDGLFTPDDAAIFGGAYDESLLPL